MAALGWAARGYSLLAISVLELITPLVRMIVLTRFLDLRELGFASALAATYGAFELTTDIAMNRFVFSRSRDEYAEALGAAHALSLARGVVVGGLAIATAPLIAASLSLSANWPSFASLGVLIFLRSFEHLGPRVAERDYRYGRQLLATITANGLSLAALAAAVAKTPDHNAVICSLFGLVFGAVLASHLLAEAPYRPRFRTPLFKKACTFGYPLMFNGLGLALSGQGDRFIVAALLGLPALGVYAVALLVTTVPMAMVGRITGSFMLAALYNAAAARTSFLARLALAARVLPLVYAGYALGIASLMNIVVPQVFGRKFELSKWALVFLSIGVFFRLVRGDPFMSLLVHEGRTKRLALANLSSISSLAFATVLILTGGRLEDAMLGRALGEATAYATTLYLTRDLFRDVIWGHLQSVGLCAIVIAVAVAAVIFGRLGSTLESGLAFLVGYVLLTVVSVWRFMPDLLRACFGNKSPQGVG